MTATAALLFYRFIHQSSINVSNK